MNKKGNEAIIAGEAPDAEEARTILEGIGTGVLAVDDRLVIRFANKKAYELFNRAPPSR